MAALRITAVRTFTLQPTTQRLVVVKVLTSEPGLYGLGCATFTQRHRAVQAALDHHLAPFVVGRDPRDTEDLWRAMMASAYWRNDPVLNNAVSGIDMALWDLKGKLAGLPCHQLWGGPCRPGAAVYVHADGHDPAAVVARARELLAQGFHFIRCQVGGYAGRAAAAERRPEGAPAGAYFDPREKLRRIPELFAHVRAELGPAVELLHDVHERLAPVDAVWLAQALAPHRLFFLEDLLAPEDSAWFAHIRAVCATPLAMGELFNHPLEVTALVQDRLIDFLRVHVSQMGGITPALKLMHLCDAYGVRTAWHGPLDTSPVGMAACVHLDVVGRNFGVQEWALRPAIEYELFPGLPAPRGGYVYPNAGPGLGIDFDESLAARFPCDSENPAWTLARLPDGTPARP